MTRSTIYLGCTVFFPEKWSKLHRRQEVPRKNTKWTFVFPPQVGPRCNRVFRRNVINVNPGNRSFFFTQMHVCEPAAQSRRRQDGPHATPALEFYRAFEFYRALLAKIFKNRPWPSGAKTNHVLPSNHCISSLAWASAPSAAAQMLPQWHIANTLHTLGNHLAIAWQSRGNTMAIGPIFWQSPFRATAGILKCMRFR